MQSVPASPWFPRLAVAFLVILFSVNVYRAWTQSITTDEAYVYNNVVGPRPPGIFNPFQSNYHPLHSHLCYISVHLFGFSEFTYRIPSLLACAFYFAAVYRISRLLFSATPFLVLSVALLTLNPLLLDHMSIARGYGLGLAFLSWALYEAMIFERSSRPDRVLYRAAILLGLTVASSLTFIQPVVAIAAMLAAFVLFFPDSPQSIGQRLWRIVDHLAGPAMVTALVLVALNLQGFGKLPGDFYGEASLYGMSDSLLAPTFHYRDCLIDEAAGCYHPTLARVGYWAAVLIFGACLGSAVVLFRQRLRTARQKQVDQGAGLVLAGTVSLAAILMIVSAALLGTPYPQARRALYYVFLVSVCFLAVCRWLWSQRGWWRAVAWMWSAGLLILTVALLLEIDVRYYVEWRFDAANKEMIQRIRVMHGDGAQPVRVIASWPLNWSLDVYRQMYGLRWFEPVDLGERPQKGFDYYVLRPGDSHLIEDLGLRRVFVSEVSHTMLAVP